MSSIATVSCFGVQSVFDDNFGHVRTFLDLKLATSKKILKKIFFDFFFFLQDSHIPGKYHDFKALWCVSTLCEVFPKIKFF